MGIVLTILLSVFVAVIWGQVPRAKNIIENEYKIKEDSGRVFKTHLLIHLAQMGMVGLALWGIQYLGQTDLFEVTGLNVNPMTAVLGMAELSLLILAILFMYLFRYSASCYFKSKTSQLAESNIESSKSESN